MNIVFLEGDMSRRGGTERMTAWLSAMLARRHRVFILSLRNQNGNLFFPIDGAVSHTVLPAGSTFRKIREIHRFIRKNNIRTVINVDTGMGYIGILAARGTGARVITWEHANFHNNWNSRLFPHLRRFAAKKSDAMVVLTERDRENYTNRIRKCVPVTVIPNPAKPADTAYNTGAKIILSAGLLDKIKRFHLLVPIGQAVFGKHPDWQWHLCGDGPERNALETAVREAGLEKNIQFCGAVGHMEGKYAAAAMYVLTSETEGLPMVLLEAKAHRLPIVSFDIETGPGDIVRDGVNGYLVQSGDTAAMADRICTLIENENLRKQFSDSAVLDMEKFDEERIVEKWEKLIAGP